MATQKRLATPQQGQLARQVTYRQLDFARGERITAAEPSPKAMYLADGLQDIINFGAKATGKYREEQAEKQRQFDAEQEKWAALTVSSQLEMAKNRAAQMKKESPNIFSTVEGQNAFHQQYSQLPDGVPPDSLMAEKYLQGIAVLMQGEIGDAVATENYQKKQAALGVWATTELEKAHAEIAKLPEEERAAAFGKTWERIKQVSQTEYGLTADGTAKLLQTVGDTAILNDRMNSSLVALLANDPSVSPEQREKATASYLKAQEATAQERIKRTNDLYLKHRKAIENGTFDYKLVEEDVTGGFIEGGTARGWDAQSKTNREKAIKASQEKLKKLKDTAELKTRFDGLNPAQVALLSGKDKEAFTAYLSDTAKAMGGEYLSNFQALSDQRGLHLDIAGKLANSTVQQIGTTIAKTEEEVPGLFKHALTNDPYMTSSVANGRVAFDANPKDAVLYLAAHHLVNVEGMSIKDAYNHVVGMKNAGRIDLSSKDAKPIANAVRKKLGTSNPELEDAVVKHVQLLGRTQPITSALTNEVVELYTKNHTEGFSRQVISAAGGVDKAQKFEKLMKEQFKGAKPSRLVFEGDAVVLHNENGFPIFDSFTYLNDIGKKVKESEDTERQRIVDKNAAHKKDIEQRGDALRKWNEQRASQFK